MGDHRETFGYDANGNLASVRAADSQIVDDYLTTGQLSYHVAAPSGPDQVTSTYSHDGLDRQYDQIDYNASDRSARGRDPSIPVGCGRGGRFADWDRIATVDRSYRETGKMIEKYDVEERRPCGGGEYPLQDGFGWSNGVTRAPLA